MKIGTPEGKSPLERLAGADAGRTATPARTDGKAAGNDAGAKVELSGGASGLLAQAGADPAFDAAKVARIAQAIAEGRYRIDAEVIADKLIANAEELLGGAQR